MIYDTFPFYNELDLLELRLYELDSVVDRFVLCEAPFTHSGKPKPLYFQENKARFAKFLPKIIHLVATDFPPADFSRPGASWDYERHQRDWIARGLVDCRPEDIVIHGDADEIPAAAAVKTYRPQMGFMGLNMSMHAYRLNLTFREEEYGWSKIFQYGFLRDIEPWTMCKIRYLVTKAIASGGWHFSFMGNPAEVADKIRAWAHQEYATPEHLDPERIRRDMEAGIDPHGRKAQYREEGLDQRYPAYLLNNSIRFRHLLLPEVKTVPPPPPPPPQPKATGAGDPRTVEWNRKVWDSYDWPKDGDEWSEMAQFSGVPYEAWKTSLIKTFLTPYLGDRKKVIEIGPGHGRWSEVILAKIPEGVLFIVDLSENCIRHCIKRFSSYDNVIWTVNDGKTLPVPPYGKSLFDFIWSFDTFVHIEEPEFRSYAREFARVLRPMGMGVIHHAGNPTPAQRAAGCRSTLSPELVARVLRENGFFVIRQTDSWEGGNIKFANDVITVFAKP